MAAAVGQVPRLGCNAQRGCPRTKARGAPAPTLSLLFPPRPQSRPFCFSRPSSFVVHAAGGGSAGFNPFSNRQSEDAAKKALREMFGNQEDKLAAYDPPPGGGKGGKGGGGGDGWFGGWFERPEFDPQRWARSFMEGLKRLLTTLGAAALFLGLLFILSFWQKVVGFIGMIITKIFRLDAGQRAIAGAGTAGNLQASLNDDKREFGVMEESVIAKYGGEDKGAEEDDGVGNGNDDDEDF